MSQVKQTNKNGITYVYDVHYYWDKEKQQSWSKKKLIGNLYPKTQEIVQTIYTNSSVQRFV